MAGQNIQRNPDKYYLKYTRETPPSPPEKVETTCCLLHRIPVNTTYNTMLQFTFILFNSNLVIFVSKASNITLQYLCYIFYE